MRKLPSNLIITPDQWSQMVADVVARSGEEACGLIIGAGSHATVIVPITNVYHDPFRFRMEPEEELKAFLSAEGTGEEIIAVYHSHPFGIDHPSATDVNELTFPGVIYLIWFQANNQWTCRAYLMENETIPSEVPVVISTNVKR